MKSLVFCLALPLAAAGVEISQLGVPEFLDTEISTNIPFVVCLDSMSRMNFSISLDAASSNCVEAAIGTDTDNDGNLSLEETDYTVGYRCGKWFQRDAIADAETEMAETDSGRIERMFTLRKRKLNPVWNLLKVTRRGVAAIAEVVLVEGKKPGAALIVQ